MPALIAPLLALPHEPALQVVTAYLERRSYFGVFFLLFLGAFGPSPPEEFVLLIAGFLVFRGIARFPLMVGVELAGIVVADSILYGRLFGGSLEKRKFLRKIFPPKKVQKTRESFHKYSYRFLFLARYLYGLRPVVFFPAGKRYAAQTTPHASLVALVEEIVPAGVTLNRNGGTTFVYAFNGVLMALVKSKAVDVREAHLLAVNKSEFENMLTREGIVKGVSEG